MKRILMLTLLTFSLLSVSTFLASGQQGQGQGPRPPSPTAQVPESLQPYINGQEESRRPPSVSRPAPVHEKVTRKGPKFLKAPAGDKTAKADVWSVAFNEGLSEAQFEAELQRVLREYNAAVWTPDHPGRVVKWAKYGIVMLIIPVEGDAKRLSEDSKIREVTQYYEPAFRSNLGRSSSGASSVKQSEASKPPLRFFSAAKPIAAATGIFRPTTEYDLDRLDKAFIFYTNDYFYNNDGLNVGPIGGTSQGVDIYLFDFGLAIAHEQFANVGELPFRAQMLNNHLWTGTYHEDHGTVVTSVAAGDTLGTARSTNVWMVRVAGIRPTQSVVTGLSTAEWVTAMNDVRDLRCGKAEVTA